MTNPVTCPHGHAYGTCLMCYHDLVGEQQSEIERLRGSLDACLGSLAMYSPETAAAYRDRLANGPPFVSASRADEP